MKSNFYLFYGTDKSLIDNEIDSLKNNIGISENDIIKYDINQIDDIVNEALTISLFSQNKFILIDATNYLSGKNAIDNIKLLEDYFENFNEDVYMVFISYSDSIDSRKKLVKLISTNGIVKKLEINDDYIKKYVDNYLIKNNFKMDNITISLFISRVGNDINNITNELNKLFLYKITDKIITKEDVEKLTDENIDDNVYNLVNAILKNDKSRAMKLYDTFVMNGMDANQIVVIIASQIRLLLQVKKLYNKGKTNDEIAKILDFKSVYRVKYLLSDSYLYSEDMLCKYLYKLAIIDKKIKKSEIDSSVLLELFIAEKDM